MASNATIWQLSAPVAASLRTVKNQISLKISDFECNTTRNAQIESRENYSRTKRDGQSTVTKQQTNKPISAQKEGTKQQHNNNFQKENAHWSLIDMITSKLKSV